MLGRGREEEEERNELERRKEAKREKKRKKRKKRKRGRGRREGERAANIGGKSRGKLDSRYIKQLDASDTQVDARTTNDY